MSEARIAYLIQQGLTRQQAIKLAKQNDRKDRQAACAATRSGNPLWLAKHLPPVPRQPQSLPGQQELF